MWSDKKIERCLDVLLVILIYLLFYLHRHTEVVWK